MSLYSFFRVKRSSGYHLFHGMFFISIMMMSVLSCSTEPYFERLPGQNTGIQFVNSIYEGDSVNVANNPFIYNGAGVGIIDVNNDGLPDIYLGGNQVSSRLYLNRGNMQFKDITEESGTVTERWVTGISVVDINNDGYSDLYCSVLGGPFARDTARNNLLFVNNGDHTFSEAAGKYGINDSGPTTHAAFLDYDKDGDLDLYLINSSSEDFGRDRFIRPKHEGKHERLSDVFYRNNGDGSFTEVTRQTGVYPEGYGLGIAVDDFNNDNWPDIYVSNDIFTNDKLWMNTQKGRFEDQIAKYITYTSFSGMGVDVADFNNDGWPDIYQVDMLPQTKIERGKTLINQGNSQAGLLRKLGYSPQEMQNTLQLHQGKAGDDIFYKEIAEQAGIDATGWSWAPLFDDLDNDGRKDIMVTNGYPKNLISLEYFKSLNNIGPFGTQESKEDRKMEALENLESIKISNKFFRNNGDSTFQDVSKKWGFQEPGFSYGAATSDLDLDGDLDLVINNLNEKSAIYKNTLRSEPGSGQKPNYLNIELTGTDENLDAIGAKIFVITKSTKQRIYVSPYRGYASTTGSKAHFGVGSHRVIDSLIIQWPNGSRQIRTNLEANQHLEIQYR